MTIEPVTTPTPIHIHLKEVIAQGRAMAVRPSLALGASQLWIMKARAGLSRLYGRDASQVDFWCPRQDTDPVAMDANAKITTRLPLLERLEAILNVEHGPSKVFIGHGRSSEWLKLRIFLSNTLGLPCDEFNIESTAGLQTTSRIESMLSSARMAFLVMTAEDHHADGSRHARENVIHEVGLFQAKLGATKAIVMLEIGCSRFSNLDGLTTINFPSGDIMARSEEIRSVLVRERVI
jgi:hypothetical protein